jgi:plasmid stability protein
MRYTIRNVPETLDAALRKSARREGKSLNEVAVQALARGVCLTESRSRQRDLSDISRTWRKDPEFDRALAAQDTIDENLLW